MTEFVDWRGWRYRVHKTRDGRFTGMMRKANMPMQVARPDHVGWVKIPFMGCYERENDALVELIEYAERKRMREINEKNPQYNLLNESEALA
ncbi:hypothetical protein [uncultured Selenomonas sp.]|uniref:hypothetical protein n=1 Tax=uncultured Selenomonas sp. TaxID=159275 RepID=UPI0028D0561D|nr:hypothetical protein [uncultured Selenomonas sp.]